MNCLTLCDPSYSPSCRSQVVAQALSSCLSCLAIKHEGHENQKPLFSARQVQTTWLHKSCYPSSHISLSLIVETTAVHLSTSAAIGLLLNVGSYAKQACSHYSASLLVEFQSPPPIYLSSIVQSNWGITHPLQKMHSSNPLLHYSLQLYLSSKQHQSPGNINSESAFPDSTDRAYSKRQLWYPLSSARYLAIYRQCYKHFHPAKSLSRAFLCIMCHTCSIYFAIVTYIHNVRQCNIDHSTTSDLKLSTFLTCTEQCARNCCVTVIGTWAVTGRPRPHPWGHHSCSLTTLSKPSISRAST